MTARILKTTGLAAALMLSASGASMAAYLGTNGNAGPTGNVGVTIAQEVVGASTIIGVAAVAPANVVTVTPVATGNLSNSQSLLTFTLSNGTFNTAVVASDLSGIGFCGIAPNIGLSSGGTVGSNTVTFVIDTAQTCSKLNWTVKPLKGVSSGSPINVSGTFVLSAGGQPVDNGITNSPAQYVKFIDANTGSAASLTSTIDLAGGATKFLVGGGATSTTTADSGAMKELVAAAKIADMTTTYALAAGDTGSLTISNIPAAVASFVLSPAVASCPTTYTQGAGTFTCAAITSADLTTFFQAAAGVKATFTIDGTTILANSAVNAKLDVKYAGSAGGTSQPGLDTKFNGTIAIIGTLACSVEYASMFGKTSAGLTTIRLSNTSGQAGKVYATATDDKGVHSAVVQLTKTNAGASAVNVLNAGDLLPAGSTLEVLGTDLETATASNFASWSGTSRGRVRLYVEASGGATGGSLGGNKGCKSEGFMCVNNTCSIMQQTGDGNDNNAIAAQKN
jgi:hypothetical protein